MQDLLIVFMKRLIKPEILEGKSTNEMIKVDVFNEEYQFFVKKIDFGKVVENYLPQITENQRKVAHTRMKDLYVLVMQYLQKNKPVFLLYWDPTTGF